ncbi:MAG TPA: class I adenylate-forming enzyme family protein [Pseudobacteroides sp.]|uniref:class I adenylate-forming enzyme family protein n=1 Tax=Pseudobacteroides sp. TaxID=1968840 RepID=UPI002F92014A
MREINRNIYSVIKRNSVLYPHNTLVSINNENATYDAFIKDADLIAYSLANLGVCPNQKIGIIMPNSVLWYKIFWAAVKIGAQPVPLDPQIGQWEMVRLMTLADIEICFAASSYRANNILQNIKTACKDIPSLKTIIGIDLEMEQDGIKPFRNFIISENAQNPDVIYCPKDNHTLMLACTSGSTGNPKVIAVPHIGFYKSQLDMADYLGFDHRDIMLLGMPLYHQGGFGMGLQMVLKGGTVVYQTLFDPLMFLNIIVEKKITVIQLTTTLAKILLSAAELYTFDLSSVRICYFAGEVLPIDIAKVFYEKLGIRVINIIGSSETGTMVVWDSLYDMDTDPSIFRPLSFTKLKVLDDHENEVQIGQVGTIFIHTDALITEYYKNEKETSLKLKWFDGLKWFNTGDLGMKLSDGRVRFAGRAKRIIKRGSNLVCPEEIEGFLLTHPDIEAIAIIGEKHPVIGERIVAYIQPKKGCIITRGKILKFCQGKMSAYKVPDQVIVTDEIPKDIGKVQYKYLNGNSLE